MHFSFNTSLSSSWRPSATSFPSLKLQLDHKPNFLPSGEGFWFLQLRENMTRVHTWEGVLVLVSQALPCHCSLSHVVIKSSSSHNLVSFADAKADFTNKNHLHNNQRTTLLNKSYVDVQSGKGSQDTTRQVLLLMIGSMNGND